MKKRLAWFLLFSIGLGLFSGSAPVQAMPYNAANPALTISAAPWPLVVNQTANVTVTASNPSGENADNVVMTVVVPNNMSLTNVSATQGQVNVYNMAISVQAGTLAPGQTMYVYLSAVVVAPYASDAPYNLCAGLTFSNGTARLSCLPNQAAGARPGTVPATLSPNGQRPISDPNRPPVYLPVSGGPIDLLRPIDLLGPIGVIGGAASLAIGLLRRRSRSRDKETEG